MKSKIGLFTVITAIFITMNVSAQSINLGIRGGLSIPNLSNGKSDNPLSSGYSSRLASDFAIFGEFQISNHFALKPMIEYSEQGGKKNGLQAFTTPVEFSQRVNQPYIYADYKSTAKLNYVLVPVLAKVGWDLNHQSNFRFFVEVGPFGGYLLSAKQITSGSSPIYLDPEKQNPISSGPISFDNKENIRSDLRHFNFGISGNIGLAYRLNGNSIFIEGGGNYGFINIQKNAVNGKNHTGAATVTIGYSYRLKR